MISFGTAIKKYRGVSGITQSVLAHRLGIQSTFLSAVENGKKEPSLTLLKKISEVLDVPVEIILWESVQITKSMSTKDKKVIEVAKELIKCYT